MDVHWSHSGNHLQPTEVPEENGDEKKYVDRHIERKQEHNERQWDKQKD